MHSEIEAKFLDVEHDAVRNRLLSLGGKCIQPMRLMRRALLDYPDFRLNKERDGFVRIRYEGDKVTLTYKEHNALTQGLVDGAKEIEVEVSNFEKTIDLFKEIGLIVKSYQESRRETWNYLDAEIVLDEWPWIKPYIEIEAQTKETVKSVSEKLGYIWTDAVFGGVTNAYLSEYPKIKPTENLGDLAEVRFGMDIPQWLKDRQ